MASGATCGGSTPPRRTILERSVYMKKIILLLVLLCSFASLAYGAPTTNNYHNDKYKFSMLIPSEFKDTPFEAPFAIHAYTNEKIFLQIKYIDPHDNYSANTFGTVPKKEIEDFIKRQRLVSALNTSKFNFINYDTHATKAGFPYVWAMFGADTVIKDTTFKTFMLKNYFLNKDIIIELDFIIPEENLKASTQTIDAIVSSFTFDVPEK